MKKIVNMPIRGCPSQELVFFHVETEKYVHLQEGSSVSIFLARLLELIYILYIIYYVELYVYIIHVIARDIAPRPRAEYGRGWGRFSIRRILRVCVCVCLIVQLSMCSWAYERHPYTFGRAVLSNNCVQIFFKWCA